MNCRFDEFQFGVGNPQCLKVESDGTVSLDFMCIYSFERSE